MGLLQTINYDVPGNFSYTPSLIEVTSNAHLLKLGLQGIEWFLASCIEGYNADRSIGSNTVTQVGMVPRVLNAGEYKYDMTAVGLGNYLSIAGANIKSNSGCFRIKITPNYSGIPSTPIYFVSWSSGGGVSTNDTVQIYHNSGSGQLVFRAYNNIGGLIGNINLGVWLPVSGTEYEFELNYNFVSGVQRLFVNGTQFGVTVSLTNAPATANYFVIGGGSMTPVNSNFYARDIQTFSAMMHTADFPFEVPRQINIYNAGSPTIVVNSGVGAEDIESFAATVTEPSGTSVSFVLNIQSVDYWYNAGTTTWEVSTSAAQSNTASVINANVDTLDVTDGYIVKVKAYLNSPLGKTSPVLTQAILGYDFYQAASPCNSCIVWGYIYDNCQPVEDATIEFKDQDNFFQTDNVISINKQVTSNALGYFEADVTITVDQPVDYKIVFTDSRGKKQSKSGTILVPNQIAISLEDAEALYS